MKRNYSNLLKEFLQLFPSLAIIGPRQCGKTTFLAELSEEWKIYDLEKAGDYQIIARDPELFLRLNPSKVALDEAQILPELFPALRVAIDSDRKEKGRFVLTGSSSPHLLRSISETLAGRIATMEMAPFTLAEAFGFPISPFFTWLAGEKPRLEDLPGMEPRIDLREIHDYWLNGGYPEPFLSKDPRFRKLWMDNYVKTYVERDVARLFPTMNQARYRTFIQILSGLSGTIVNYSDVSRNLSVSAPTAREYFDIAHGSFLWRQVPAYEKKAVKRIVKHPKGYMRDTGILHYLMHIGDVDGLLAHPSMGASWEGMVIEQILRNLNALGIPHECFYYRTGGGAEVDLVLEGAFGTIPVEIKYTQHVPERDLRSIGEFVRERKCPFGILINNDERVRFYEEKLIGIPLGCL